jgi:hypothetical protein
MTKYNHYAKELDEAFKTARAEYKKAYEEYIEAKKAFEILPKLLVDVERKEKTRHNYKLAEIKFNEANRTVWQNFNNRRAELRRQLETEVAKNGIVNPESVDMATVELLKSGVLTADDYTALAEKNDDNSTMLKLIAKYAKEAANDTERTASERGRLSAISTIAKDGKPKTIRNWDDLSTVADYCSNQRNAKTANNYEHTMQMSEAWEECSAETIANF